MNRRPQQLPDPVRAALATMSWNNCLRDPQPMHFKSLEAMRGIRTPPIDVLETVEILERLTAAAAPPRTQQHHHLARVATALLLLGNGYADEAHDLVLPLSWRGDLPYSHGPPVAVADEEIHTLACYAHCLVHRREGPHDSEFGMTGWQNSNYWAGMTMRNLDGLDCLPLDRIRETVAGAAAATGDPTLASRFAAPAHAAAVRDGGSAFPSWDPRLLTELCEQVCADMQQQSGSSSSSSTQDKSNKSHHALHREFAERCALAELRILLEHVLSRMGFDASR